MNTQTHHTDKTIKTPIIAAIRQGATKRPFWQAQPSGLSREETRRLVLEMIG